MTTDRKSLWATLLRLGLLAGLFGCTTASEARDGKGERRRSNEPNLAPGDVDGTGGASGMGGAGEAPPTPQAGRDSGGDASLAGAGGEAGEAGAGGSAGAAQGAPEGEGGSAGSACREPVLGLAVVEHSCVHAEQGPYVDLIAATDEAGAPAVNAPHTAYRVRSSGGSLSWVRFTAATSGSHALLGTLPPSLTFTLGDGALVRSVDMSTSCASLPSARVLELSSSNPLTLSWAEGDLVLVVEALAPFGQQAWEQGCACAESGAACAGDADCCSGYCADGACESVEVPICSGKALVGEPCQAEQSCCSGHCVDARCAAPVCRSSGPCVSDSECCLFCHDQDHCH
jgi:hypothetical protein